MILESRTHSVGQKRSNAWGLYDMYGNVWEWVQDNWHGNYDGAPADGSAWIIGGLDDRVIRGGSSYASKCTSAVRNHYFPGNGDRNIGFRLVRDV